MGDYWEEEVGWFGCVWDKLLKIVMYVCDWMWVDVVYLYIKLMIIVFLFIVFRLYIF